MHWWKLGNQLLSMRDGRSGAFILSERLEENERAQITLAVAFRPTVELIVCLILRRPISSPKITCFCDQTSRSPLIELYSWTQVLDSAAPKAAWGKALHNNWLWVLNLWEDGVVRLWVSRLFWPEMSRAGHVCLNESSWRFWRYIFYFHSQHGALQI